VEGPLDQVCMGIYDACRCIEQGKPKPILLPHIVQDELHNVCLECGNPALKHSDFGALMHSIHEVCWQGFECAYVRVGIVSSPVTTQLACIRSK
jgi:hypothetical protein